MIEIRKIENQETFEEVYLDDDMKMISGKWVDAEPQELPRHVGYFVGLRSEQQRTTATRRQPPLLRSG